ncbi:MAG: hypothetical protein L3K02_04730 [Thermoplasmata archaeon]|nr:hypothetical protein [Thermoplasmata archaeon]
MSEAPANSPKIPPISGIAPGIFDPVISILKASSAPIRRRKLLEELERRGHRISLAGLNRVLQHCAQSGLTVESPEGVRLRAGRG